MSLSRFLTDFTPANASCFEQRLTMLDVTLPAAIDSVRELLLTVRASAVRLHNELEAIQVPAHFPRNYAEAVCFDCGMRNLEVFYTSKHGQYRLCALCFDTRESRGRARSSGEPFDAIFNQSTHNEQARP